MTHAGLPHSEIRVSRPTCGSARLFAAYRVLHRLGTPRHPPYALCSLTISTRGDLFAPSFVAHRLLFVDVALLRLLTKTEALLAIHENLARLCRCISPFRNIVIRCLCLNPKMSVKPFLFTLFHVYSMIFDTFRFFCVVFKEQIPYAK